MVVCIGSFDCFFRSLIASSIRFVGIGIAGGVESMSLDRVSNVGPGAKADAQHPASATNPLIDGTYWTMGQTSEEVAKQFGMSRERQDYYAFHSQKRALEAHERGVFKDEIVGVVGKGDTLVVADEGENDLIDAVCV
jgi:acetyl-CoA acetyltransferase